MALKDILSLFCEASGMMTSDEKSCIYFRGGDESVHSDIANLFSFLKATLNDSITYLGFRMKALKYTSVDWKWLITKYQNKLNLWSAKWLSRGEG